MHRLLGQLLGGAASALAAVGATEVVAVLVGLRSPLDDAVRISVDRSPALVVETTVRVLGVADKPVARASTVAVVVLASAGAAGRGRWAAATAPVVGAAAGLLAARRTPPLDPVPLQALALGAGAAAGAAAALTGPRRSALLAGAGTAGLLASLRSRGRAQRQAGVQALRESIVADAPLPPAVDGAEDWPGVQPLHTPLDRVYVTDVNMRPPRVNRAGWRLTVDGAVGEPCDLKDADLLALGTVEVDAALVCIHSRPGWHRLAQQRFTGVPLTRVLDAAGAFCQQRSTCRRPPSTGSRCAAQYCCPTTRLSFWGWAGAASPRSTALPRGCSFPGFTASTPA